MAYKLGWVENGEQKYLDYESGKPLDFETESHARNYLNALRLLPGLGDSSHLSVVEMKGA